MSNWWQEFLDWITKYKDALSVLLGSGILIVIVTGIYKLIAWLVKARRARKSRMDISTFKVIPPNSNVAKEILGGSDDDPLADRNIPYQQRVHGRNIRREIEELLDKHRWTLITGRTGLGKTREAVHVAESLNKEGWTVLYLTRDQWLDAPSHLPNGIPERKLLFLLDDLNRKCFAGRVEQSPKADELLQPLTEPLQKRLQRTLEAYETLCGKGEIRVLATARDEQVNEYSGEPSEWEKLEFSKYQSLWQRFSRYELGQPEDSAAVTLLIQIVPKAKVQARSEDFASIAHRNDSTFANLVENLRTSRNTGEPLNRETFRETLKGTWEKRYHDAITRNWFAKYIYDAVDLTRSVRLHLSFWNVFSIANILSKNDWRRIFFIKNRVTLRYLLRTENILAPRDGQVEAKGYEVEIQKYLSQLYLQIANQSYSEEYKLFIILIFLTGILSKNFFLPEKKLSIWLKILTNLFPLTSLLLHVTGDAYGYLGFSEYALLLHERSLELGKWNLMEMLSPGNRALGWRSLGHSYIAMNRADDAIDAFQKSIKLNPKSASAWNGLGNVYLNLGKVDEAFAANQKAIDLDPKYVVPWYDLGNVYYRQDKYADAIATYQKAIELDPKFASPWNGLGFVYYLQGKYPDAIAAYQKAIECNPKVSTYHQNLAEILDTLGLNERALSEYREAMELEPSSVTRVSFAGFLRRMRSEAEANEQINLARPLMEKENEYNRACFESICGNVEESLRLLKIAMEKKQTSLEWARRDRDFDFIHDDSRFKKLVGIE